MANSKISQLTSATLPLAGTEVLPIVQSSATRKVATDDLTVKNIRSNATTGLLQVVGPAAGATRVMTTPNANFTAARTDAAQTFTGSQTISGGNLIIGTAGNGIDFSADAHAAGMTSELLNDYEEGSWTPVPKFGGNNVGMTYTSSGSYTKIGRVVSIQGAISISANGTSTGNMTIEGLPYSISGYVIGGFLGDGFNFTGASLAIGAFNGNSYLWCLYQQGGTGAAAGYAILTQANIAAGSKYFNVVYRVP